MVKVLLEHYHLLRLSDDLNLREYLIDLHNALNKLDPDDLKLIQIAYIVPTGRPKTRQYRESRNGRIRTIEEMTRLDPSLNAVNVKERLNVILDKLEKEMVHDGE